MKHEAYAKSFITTYTGKEVRCPGLRLDMINLRDIARALSMQVRFLGHLIKFYSVAEHSVLCAELAMLHGEPDEVVKATFLHDAHEAYIGDFPSPFKNAVVGLKPFEEGIEATVRDGFMLPHDGSKVWDKVKQYDTLALHKEAATLLQAPPSWVNPDIVEAFPKGLRIQGLEWHEAEGLFLQRAKSLGVS